MVRGQRERILVLAGHLPLRGHFFGRQAHAVGDGDVFFVVNMAGLIASL